ncbi:MAG: efflux RND transporter periplasmic adaptor subunit [Proteobacteria bacterium]|jgi:HlyD family secretion protein|nr:efflux RND transporter periplasmic adaptor subunit [Pseudomonadota bacterium]
MKSRTKVVVLVASVVLFVAAFVWLLTTHGPLAPVGVQLGSVVRADLTPSVFGIGTVDARLAYAVGPIAPGRVLRVLVDQGEAVKAGQLLAEMDPVDLDRRVQASESAGARSRRAVQVANAQVAEATSRKRLATTNRDRDRALYEQRVISKQVLDSSTGEVERAEAALAAARANAAAVRQDVGRVDAESQGLGSLRESLRLVSPADGVVVSREAEPGTTVVAGGTVLRVVVPESLWVRARVDQSRAQGLREGQLASIVLRSAPEAPIPGRVARIEMQSDPVTEERVVNVSFDAPPARLYLGELAEVTIRLPDETGVLVVPSAAIAREGSVTGVWQMVEGRARFKQVTIGNQGQAGVTRILSGLSQNDSVIVYSSAQLTPGVRLREQKVEQP